MIVEHTGGGRQTSIGELSPEELEQRAKENLDKAKQLIVDHPLAAAGGALAIGAVLGLLRPRGKSGLFGTAITGIVMALVRDAVVRKVSTFANGWIDMKSREEAVSRQREVESFEH